MNRRERTVKPSRVELLSDLQSTYTDWQNSRISRREFLCRAGMLAATGVTPVLQAAENNHALPFRKNTRQQNRYVQEPWQTINAVQQQLFPSEKHAPGADEINATEYLKTLLADDFPDAEEKQFILSGPGWLNELATTQHQQSFVQLSGQQQNTLLRQIARTTAGENWLATLLSYIFEALLAAPVYGGNPGGMGWKWLKFQPGFPLPDKKSLTWQQLQKR